MDVFVRPATLSDIHAIAVIRDLSFRNHAVIQAAYGPVSSSEFQRFVRERYENLLRDPSKRSWVAIQRIQTGGQGVAVIGDSTRHNSDAERMRKDAYVSDGEVVGYLSYQRKGLGDEEGAKGVPPVRLPRTTDRTCLELWKDKKNILLERWCRDEPKYALGDLMGVNPM